MSNGYGFGMSWQDPVGWLDFEISDDAKGLEPLTAIAKKLVYYMVIAYEKYGMNWFNGDETEEPTNEFYTLYPERGMHQCTINNCWLDMGGVFGYNRWKFPCGIIHYILDHNWVPPQQFLDDLALLPDSPDVVTTKGHDWIAPNNNNLFH